MITIVISTCNERISSVLLPDPVCGIEYIIVHQMFNSSCNCFVVDSLKSRCDVRYFELKNKGLSKSRNFGLINIKTRYGYVMDDDVLFDLDKIKYLVNWMQLENVDVATCRHQYENGEYPKKYKDKPFKHNLYSLAKVASIDICFNAELLQENNIFFDERFGLGTDLPSGEEYIFLASCLKKSLNIYFFPITVGVHPNVTSGMDFYTSYNKTLAKREMFKCVFGWKAYFFIFLFWLKKIKYVSKSGFLMPFTKRILFGLKG